MFIRPPAHEIPDIHCPYMADKGISQALLMLVPLRWLDMRVHTVSHEEPVDKLICSDERFLGDEVVDM